MATKLENKSPIEVGHNYLFRFQIIGWGWLKCSTTELKDVLERFLPADILDITTASITSDLNWINITLTPTGSIGPILVDNVEGWVKAIGDVIKGEGLIGGIAALRFHSAWEVADLNDVYGITHPGPTPWYESLWQYIKQGAIIAGVLGGLYITARLLSEVNKLLGKERR